MRNRRHKCRAEIDDSNGLLIGSPPTMDPPDPSGQDVDVSVRPVHADALAVADQAGGVLHADDGGEAVLPRDYGAVGHQAADLRHQALDRDEQGRLAGVREGGDQDVARLEIGLGHVRCHRNS
jgi:hypothetical protein